MQTVIQSWDQLESSSSREDLSLEGRWRVLEEGGHRPSPHPGWIRKAEQSQPVGAAATMETP